MVLISCNVAAFLFGRNRAWERLATGGSRIGKDGALSARTPFGMGGYACLYTGR